MNLIQELMHLHVYSDPAVFIRFVALFCGTFLVLYIFKKGILSQLYRFAKKTTTNIDDFILDVMKIWNWFILVVISFYVATQSINMPTKLESLLSNVLLVAITWYVVQTVLAAMKFSFNRYVAQRQRYEEDFDPTIIMFLRQVTTFIVWILAILVLVQNLGYEVSALVGGLGLGGLAVAFAVQNLLSDVFSSISIYFDKPFKIGDFIVVGDDAGVVKKIGIKSTRLQTLQGQELVISNKELTETRVNNYKRMQSRRIVFEIGVEYGTKSSKLKKIPTIMQAIIEKHENATFDRSHFKSFGDFSLNFETVYIVNSADFTVYMDTQQGINIAIVEAFEKEGISIAFPTQKILTAKA